MPKLAQLFPEEETLVSAFRACEELRIHPRIANGIATFDIEAGLLQAGEPALPGCGKLQFQQLNQYWYLLPSNGLRAPHNGPRHRRGDR